MDYIPPLQLRSSVPFLLFILRLLQSLQKATYIVSANMPPPIDINNCCIMDVDSVKQQKETVFFGYITKDTFSRVRIPFFMANIFLLIDGVI